MPRSTTDAAVMCTLEGGSEAIGRRRLDWQAVIARANGRVAADRGVGLTFAHDQELAAELARLAAAEFTCCSFFDFTLSVSAAGMRFTVAAPDEARDLVAALFGTADQPAVEAVRTPGT